MATVKCHLTLEQYIVDRLELEGRGTGAKYQAKGIEALILKLDVAAPRVAARDTSTTPTHDPDKPHVDGRTQIRLDREAREREAAEKEAYDRPRQEFKSRMHHSIVHSKPEHIFAAFNEEYADQLSAEERREITTALFMDLDVLVERDRNTAAWEASMAETRIADAQASAGWTPEERARDYQRRHNIAPETVVQTERLSDKALKGLGIFGTPEALTDEQIREINADWAARYVPITQAPTEDDSEGWA